MKKSRYPQFPCDEQSGKVLLHPLNPMSTLGFQERKSKWKARGPGTEVAHALGKHMSRR